jgi:hypothetical protein
MNFKPISIMKRVSFLKRRRSSSVLFISILTLLFQDFTNTRLPSFFYSPHMRRVSATGIRCRDIFEEAVVIADDPQYFGEVQGFLFSGLKELHFPVHLLTRQRAFGYREKSDRNTSPLPFAPCRNESIVCFWTTPCTQSPPFDGTYTWDIPTKTVLINLEVLDRSKNENAWFLPCLNDPKISNMVWPSGPNLDYLHGNVDLLGTNGLGLSPNVQYLKLRYYPGIAHQDVSPKDSNITKIYDVLFIGSRSPRRNIILTTLSEIPGIKLKIVQDSIFGQAREEIVRQSRIVINLHYYEKNFETVRLFWLLSLGAFVIAEADQEINSRVMEEYEGSMVFSTYEDFVETVKKHLEPEMENERMRIAMRGYDFIRSESPGQVLGPLLESGCSCTF